jgi:hypothetical protein
MSGVQPVNTAGLAINLATRGRPDLVYQTVLRSMANIERADTVFMVSCDEDDPATVERMNALAASGVVGHLIVSVEPREDTVAAKWNRVLSRVDAKVYMPMCDDGPVLTGGFDQKILDAAALFPDDGIGVVFNYLENLSFTGIQAVTAPMAKAMGHIYVEYFPYWFVDHWLDDIAKMTGRIAFADVRLDCASNRNGGGPTMEMREPPFWATLYDALMHERRAIADRILNRASDTDWRRDKALRSCYPLIEQRSRMLNDNVRAMRVVGPEPDERYGRIKAAAVERLTNALPTLREVAA